MPEQSGPNRFEVRRQALQSLLQKRELDFLVVTKPPNIFYLTGFRGTAGVSIIGDSEALLWVDPRYTLQARQQASAVQVIEEKGRLLKAAGRWLRKRKRSRMGYDDAHVTCAQFRELSQESGRAVSFQPANGLVEELREVKDPEETNLIRKAGRLTAQVFEEVLRQVRPGLRERDLAAEIEYRMRRKGADGAAFETIVASGWRAAMPHARASDTLLKSGELVIFDLGAILGGYAADMTRTIYLGEPSRRIRTLYNAVIEAQEQTVKAVRPGTRAGDVDSVARRVLGRRGLGRYFTHSTGHGVGLEVHERPRLGRGERARLKAGCVVTVEPGIYVEGFGGIRVEDTVLVGADGPEILTPAAKDRWFTT